MFYGLVRPYFSDNLVNDAMVILDSMILKPTAIPSAPAPLHSLGHLQDDHFIRFTFVLVQPIHLGLIIFSFIS